MITKGTLDSGHFNNGFHVKNALIFFVGIQIVFVIGLCYMHNIRKISQNSIISCKSYYFKMLLSILMFVTTVTALICTVEKFHSWMMCINKSQYKYFLFFYTFILIKFFCKKLFFISRM